MRAPQTQRCNGRLDGGYGKMIMQDHPAVKKVITPADQRV
jgi:hypothetical protein